MNVRPMFCAVLVLGVSACGSDTKDAKGDAGAGNDGMQADGNGMDASAAGDTDAATGGGSADGDNVTSYGCDNGNADATKHECVDSRLTNDDGSLLEAGKSACMGQMFTIVDACSRDGAVGGCLRTTEAPPQKFENTVWHYGGDAAALKAACEQSAEYKWVEP